MSYSYRAVALDYDGTITENDRPAPGVLEAVAKVRASGRRVVLVTGRILAELRAVFPDVHGWFDAVVAENGAVLALGSLGAARALASALPASLAAALAGRGIPHRRGQVLIALDAAHDRAALEEIARLGLEAQIVRNRAALMILPAGVSKGTGLHEALGELGVSHHSCLAVGDAENDHSLLDVAELGVAVANAVPALAAHADVVLSQADGAGVAALLGGPLLRGEIRVQPRRWQIEVGHDEAGAPVAIPASQVNVLIAGTSGSGKSHLGGLLAERLLELGYSIAVLDAEGDHAGLGGLRGVVRVGGGEPLPRAERLVELVRHRFGSVVADLSLLPLAERGEYGRRAILAWQAERAARGLPHWIITDEAHVPLGVHGAAGSVVDPSQKGLCIVTYLPEQLCERVLADVDVLFALGDPAHPAARLPCTRAIPGLDERAFREQLRRTERGHALLVRRESPERIVRVTLAPRGTPHVRHWNKYARAALPAHLHFHFRRDGSPDGRVAANVEELHAELGRSDDAVIRHHATHGDLSRWIAEALQDRDLAGVVRQIELDPSAGAAGVRRGVRTAIEQRYLR